MRIAQRLLAVCLLFLCSMAWAQDLSVEATGYGPTIEAATRAAQRAALEKGVGQVISSQTEMENFTLKKDLVLTRTEGSVKSTEVLNKLQGPDGAWEVTVKAVVSKEGIRNDLMAMAILRAAVGNPRVAILISEKVLGQDVAEGAAEVVVVGAFKEREFEVVEPSDAIRQEHRNQISLAAGGDLKAISDLGKELGAEVVIAGTAIATEADVSNNAYFANSAMKSASANVTLKAVDVSTREILASKTGDAPMVHVNAATAGTKAVEKATQKVLDKNGFIDMLLKSWQRKANDGSLLRVTIKNIPNFQASQLVQEEIRTEAVSVTTRKLAGGTLSLDVIFRGTAEDFCSAIDGRKINKDRNKVVVQSVEGSSIALEVKDVK